MIIYAETRARFLRDVDQNALQGKLKEAFQRRTGWVPSDHRVWADEYSRFSLALRKAQVSDGLQVALEYHISAAGRSRVDALLAGNDGERDQGMIVELKAWDTARTSDVEGMVWAPIGGGRPKQHPCEQARRYRRQILHFNADMQESGIGLHAAAYLFNLYRRRPEPLEDDRYAHILADSRLFLADDVDPLCAFLERHLRHEPRRDVLFLIDQGRLAPAPALIERVSSMLEGNEEFQLIDEQYEAYQIIRHALFSVAPGSEREVFIVEGGPGTGKSVIAVRLLADVLKARRMGFLVAPNSAFRETLVASLARGNKGYRDDGSALVRSSWSFDGADYARDKALDVLIVDEAHRLKDRAYRYLGESMVEDMVRACRLSVFFVDETQRVTWGDSGGIERIRTAAQKFGAVVHEPLPLKAQFRCSGSTGYLNWLDDVLQIRRTGNFDNWADGDYQFRVFDKAEDLHSALREHNVGNKARLIAGYAWEWPTKRRARGGTDPHVQADGLSMPWNYDGETWATAPDGIEQAGCVHTSQGIEFDWIGVLIGEDLRAVDGVVRGEPSKRARTDKSLHGWKKALKGAGKDEVARQAVLDRVQSIMKNTYKVLMSRGRRGCFVWCADAGLRDYLRARLALARHDPARTRPATDGAVVPLSSSGLPSGCVSRPAPEQSEKYVPVCGPHGVLAGQGDARGWLRRPEGLAPDPMLFVARVSAAAPILGVPAGAWCLFRLRPPGVRRSSDVLLSVAHAPETPPGEALDVRIEELASAPSGPGAPPPMVAEMLRVLPGAADEASHA